MDAENSPNSNDSLLNARIGFTLENRYRILDVLAEGGMGVVYRGERVGTNRPVAVKFLHASFAADMKVRERFERELQIMSRLTHPNCISVVDYGIADSPFIVMEYVNGPTLRHVLAEEGRLSPVRALFIASQILAALAHAHSQDMVHRDIKPGNIILSDIEGTLDHVYVLDFGLAKFLSGARSDDLTASGMLLGTPSYMSPEQARAQAIGAATDIYSTGVVLFELLTGTKPFTGQNALDILHHHQFSKAPSIRDRAPECRFSKELDEAIRTAMAKAPAQRFPSATAFARALDQVPEAASIRTSTKLRALTPPPGLFTADPAPSSESMAEPVMDLLETIGGAPLAAAPPSIGPEVRAGQASAAGLARFPSLPDHLLSPAESSTQSTLVPGALQPRATAHALIAIQMSDDADRREDTPLAIAVGARGRFGAGTARLALAGALVSVIGLAAWLATGNDGERAEQGEELAQAQLGQTAVAGTASPKPAAETAPSAAEVAPAAQPAEPELELHADEAEPDMAGEPEPDVQDEAKQVALEQPADEPDPAGAPAPEVAKANAAVQTSIARPSAAEPARAQPPRRAAQVDTIEDVERLIQQGRRDEAIQGILRLRRTHFTRSGYLAYQLGNLYFAKKQWNAGLDAYADALRLKPEYRGNPVLNANTIRALASNQTWRKASDLYVERIRQAGAKYLREAAQSDKNGTVRQRAKQVLGRIGKK
jgi:serine/threonine protein kinase/tetratricopeptide (TPR) repeat protein